MAKVFKTIKSVVFTIVGIAYFAFALFMTVLLLNFNEYGVTQFGKKQMVLIKEELAIKDFSKGDLVILIMSNEDLAPKLDANFEGLK